MLDVGGIAPDFSLLSEHGEYVSLADFLGQYVVLYFYPKDDTPGCTAEACALRDRMGEFARLGVQVLGVSADSVASHLAFKEKYGLPFTLLSDPKREVIGLYEAKKGVLTRRITYIIGPDGKIVKVYPKVDPAGHAEEILADL
jgi:peroxiredoxin Q/BCP